MFSDASLSIVGGPKTAPSLKDYTSTFILSPASGSEQVLFEVPKALNVDLDRQRRAHQKSRTGCENCRKRRVKCTVETPCASCTRRGEHCQRLERINRRHVPAPSSSTISTQTLLPRSRTTNAAVNLGHIRLFHHFHTCTLQTLSLAPAVWDHALKLCFDFDFLMNAVLCIAARHLAVLQPEDPTYPIAASSHLCRALSRFRHALSNNLTLTHVDAFIATSHLLQYEVWTNSEICTLQEDEGVVSFAGPPKDRMFSFCSSLKQVFLKSVSLASHKSSIFMPQVRKDPRDVLVEVAQISHNTLIKCQEFFSYQRPLSTELLNLSFPYTRSTELLISNPWQRHVSETRENALDPIKDGYIPVITQLCLILSFLPEARPPDLVSAVSPFLPQLERFILLFPVVCHGPFVSMVQHSDPHALLLLYHFYRAVRILLPLDRCWWAHKRAKMSEIILKQWLINQSTQAS